MHLQEITEEYRDRVNQILKEEWNCPPSISRGIAIDTTVLPGFLFIENDAIKGVVTYHIRNKECEIVTLNSFEENRGIGTALILEVLTIARENKCKRLWLITTNDAINAIRFYQMKGFDLKAVHINAMEISRKLKPSIPLIGMDQIPIKHELEFEILLEYKNMK
jgi:GNAT superfamily N-acetyltransferase